MKTAPASSKRVVRYFLSYAHDDGKLPDKLLTELDKQLRACKDYTFQRWQDTHILPGEKWHEEIQKAAKECDFGLLLVSPAFLGSKYIGEHELPLFVSGVKPCVPVGLCRIDFDNHDTKGLNESQIYLHATPNGKTRRYFADCTGKQAADFALNLFTQIKARLTKLFASAPPAPPPLPPKPEKTTNNLPRLTPFFGRQKELDVIAKALLPQTRTWGVLIDGPGGIGKTSLAIRAAEIATPQFDRVLFVSTKVQKLTPDGAVAVSNSIVPAYPEMLNEIARLIGLPHIPERPEEERPGLIKAAVQQEKVLLILDNLENLDKIQQNLLFEFVSDLPPSCKAIVTSRRRTDVDARIIRLEKLDQDAALEFLEELSAGRALLAKATREERLHLYEETGGNPLLLRWIVGQLGHGGCRNLASALDLCRKAAEENDPLEFIFGDLLETFTEAETKALAALTYFSQKIEVKFIAELADLSKKATQTALGDLANRALVIPDVTDEAFALVPMVADYLRRKRPEVVEKTGNRLENRAYALIMENYGFTAERFRTLDSLWPAIAPALPRFIAGDDLRFTFICSALITFLGVTGRWDEHLALCQQTLNRAATKGDDEEAGWWAFQIAKTLYSRRQADEVLAYVDLAESHWQSTNVEVSKRASVVQLRGHALRLKKDFPAAISAYLKVVEMDRGIADESVEVAIGLIDLAAAEKDSGDFDASENHCREALRIARAVGAEDTKATIIGNLADLAHLREEWAVAEALAREALCLAEAVRRDEVLADGIRIPKHFLSHEVLQVRDAIDREVLFANVSQRLAHALVRQGHAAEALPHARKAVELYTRLGSPGLAEAQATLRECRVALALERLNHGWTYNTTTLEGSTLSLSEVELALNDPAAVIANRPAEHVAQNRAQAEALKLLADYLKEDRDLTPEDLFRLHTLLMKGTTVDYLQPIGGWKVEDNGTPVMVDGKRVWNDAYAAASHVRILMDEWLRELNRRRSSGGDAIDDHIWLHATFVRIHPFADGNGRMARMLANLPLLAQARAPVDIPAIARERYLAILPKWQIACGPPRPNEPLFPKADLLADFAQLCATSRAPEEPDIDLS